LDWLIAGGLVGLLSDLSIFIALLYYVAKSSDEFLKREDKAVLLGLVAAYTFHNIFVFDQIGSYILFFTLLAYIDSRVPAANFSLWNKISTSFGRLADKNGLRPVFESFTMILLLIVFYFVVWTPWQQNKSLLTVLQLNSEGKLTKADDFLKPLQKYTMGYSEAIEHVSQAAIGFASNSQASAELKASVYDGVEEAYQKFLVRVPNDARYRLFHGIFLSSFGKYPEGTAELVKASELSPSKQGILFQLANNYLVEGKTAEATATAKKAYELEPSYDEAKIFYGLMLMIKGDPAASEILSTVPEEKLVFDDRFMSVLQQLGRYDQLITVAKRRTEIDSVNPQYKLNLAAAYLLAGRRQDAVNVLQQMIAADPTFKEKGEYYINEIKAGRNP
jgi:tetratricopeptide (TPR) repeat protein